MLYKSLFIYIELNKAIKIFNIIKTLGISTNILDNLKNSTILVKSKKRLI